MGKAFSFIVGATIGAAAGTIAGILLAPRSGAETRAMAADMANDAWDNARDMYEQGAKFVLARERMDQLRETLNDAISGAAIPAVDVQVEVAPEAAEAAPEA